jgi:hypothetical protein
LFTKGKENYKPKHNKQITAMKTKLIKTTVSSSLFACALVMLAMAATTFGTARAETRLPGCGVYTLHGLYLFDAHGWNIVGGVAVPKAIVEGIDFNGDGTLVSPFSTVSVNGTIIRSSGTPGSYMLNADCTGTITFSPGPRFDIFADPLDRHIWMIQTGPEAMPAVFEGTATRVSR